MARLVELSEPGLRELLVRLLGSGGVAIVPCDTIYGIVGAAPETEGRIRAIKGRGETKPFIQLIPGTDWLDRVALEAPPAPLLGLWPAELTIVLPGRTGGTIAVRVPADELLRTVMRQVGRPLYSTSVNFAGSPALGSPGDIVRAFGELVDLVVAAGDRAHGVPSTIVDATVRPPRVLRQGRVVIPAEILRA